MTAKREPKAAKIDRVQRAAAANGQVLSFAGGLPDPKAFPRAALTRAFLRIMSDPRAPSLQYGWPEGMPELRGVVAARLKARGVHLHPDDVLITSGAQQAIAIATQLVFRGSKKIALDAETYSGALEVFRARKLEISVDLEGAAGAYVMPQIANPRGNTMTLSRRSALIHAAKRRGLLVIEDDAYADLDFGLGACTKRPLLAEIPQATFYIGTFSKSLCPGLRVGWLVPPARFRVAALEAKRESDLQANSLAQAILADFFLHEDFDARLGWARTRYSRRASCLAEALRLALPGWHFEEPAGGFSIWVETDAKRDDAAFLDCAVAAGVSFDPGTMFRIASDGYLRLRLSYSFVPPRAIVEGVTRLAKAWRTFQRTAPASHRGHLATG